MCMTDPGPDRAELGFSEAVLSAFAFLTKEYAFHLETLTPTLVRFESPSLFVNIYHGRSSYELGFEVGQRADEPRKEESKFSLGDILDLMDENVSCNYAPPQASTANSVRAFVPKLATLVQTYAGPVLRGDAGVFERLEGIQTKKSQDLLRDWKLKEVREKAESAWRRRDYAKLVSLFESVQQSLTPAEAKKLDYAKKRLQRK